jgi:hypothetical protein
LPAGSKSESRLTLCLTPHGRLLLIASLAVAFNRLADSFLARTGELQRAAFRPAEMRELLERHGFVVRSDHDGLERLRHMGVTPSFLYRVTKFHHVVIADVAAT